MCSLTLPVKPVAKQNDADRGTDFTYPPISFRELMYDGVHVDSITADQTATARSAAIDNFRSGKTWVLIATDLIGRGMDFIGVNTVVNYDFPHSTVDYIHRIGRTGRAGKTGA